MKKHRRLLAAVLAVLFLLPLFCGAISAEELISGPISSEDQGANMLLTRLATTADITYCANSPMRRLASFDENSSYYTKKARIIIPEYFQSVSNCSGHTYGTYPAEVCPSGTGSVCQTCGYNSLTVNGLMWEPFKVNTTKSITAYASKECFRIAIGIAYEDNPATWTHIGNTDIASVSYTFSQKGLYTIRIAARDIDNSGSYESASSSAVHVFTVRVW